MAAPETAAPLKTLPRILGPFDATMVVVGSVIGTGIFLKPGIAAAELPYVGLIFAVWIGVGIITICGCLALGELAAMLPQAGGPYVYLREAYGRLPAFLWGWTEFWIVRTGSIGALSVGTALYLAEVAELDRAGQEAVAIGIVLVLSALNYVSTRWTARLQNVTSIIKVAFLVSVIVLPFFLMGNSRGHLEPLWPSEMNGTIWRGILLAMVAVMWPYDGWINIGPVAEEVREPQRNVPLALTAGIGTVIVVYLAANLAYHMVLPLDQIATSKRVVGDLFRALLGERAAEWAAVGVMCSAFGAVNSNMLTGPRIYFAMARDGLLPRFIDRVHDRYETPHNAIVLQCVWTLLLIVVVFRVTDEPVAAFNKLTDYVIFGGYIFYNLAVAAVFVLRWKRPELPRPYRTWGYPVTPALYTVSFGTVLVNMLIDPSTRYSSLAGLSLIAAGVPFYFWMRYRNRPA